LQDSSLDKNEVVESSNDYRFVGDNLKDRDDSYEINDETVDTASKISNSTTDDESSDTESEVSDSEEPPHQPLDKLCKWAIKNGVPLSNVDDFLKNVLKGRILKLTVTSKTLFKFIDKHQFIIESFALCNDLNVPSGFVHFGLAEYMKQIVYVKNHEKNLITLKFFTDGLPLFKSSKVEFWPLIAKIKFPVNLYQPF